MDSSNIYKQVQTHYGALARAKRPSSSSAIAQAFGYSEEELNSIPHDANLGLSCGNPLAIASLQEGEIVIDLGSGAGFDVFLVAKKVGPKGRAVGIDMNKDMLARARDNYAVSGGGENVSFVEGKITSIPIEDGVADCIISNCVINLVPEAEKATVFAEMARLLKSGGRVAISDILARKPFPTELRESVAAYVGCVAGCSPKEDYEHFLAENGFRDIVIMDTQSDLNVYVDVAKNEDVRGCCGPSAIRDTSETTQETPCCPEEKAANCCRKTESGESDSEATNPPTTSEITEVACCPLSGSKMPRAKVASWDLSDIDINEWAGSFKIFAVKT